MHHRRVGVRLPARVGAFRFGFRTGQLAQRIQHAHDIIFAAVDQRANQAVNLHVVAGHGHHADVQRGFHHAFCHIRVADDAVWRGVQQTHKGITRLGRQRRLLVSNRLQQHSQVFLFGRQLVFQDRLVLISQRFQRVRFIRGHGDCRERFTRDRVAQGAAVEIDQAQIQLFSMACEEACQQLVGIT